MSHIHTKVNPPSSPLFSKINSSHNSGNNIVTDEGYLTPLGQPYDCVELQSRFDGMSMRDIYTFVCKKRSCTANRGVVAMLSDKVSDFSVECIDLSRNYLGPKGILCLLECVKLLPKLTKLILTENYLDNTSVHHLGKVLLYHPSIAHVSVAKNPITWCGGMCLLELVEKNAHIDTLDVTGTLLTVKFLETIRTQVKKNHKAKYSLHRVPNPTSHQKTIQIRVLKRLYRSLLQSSSSSSGGGRVTKKGLLVGIQEYNTMCGKESTSSVTAATVEEAYHRTGLFTAAASSSVVSSPDGCHSISDDDCASATSPSISWECYMLVIMTPRAYDADFVARLHSIFQLFDEDNVGYVEVEQLCAILTMLYGNRGAPSKTELQLRKQKLSAQDDMTLSWEELLYMVYDHVPVGNMGDVVLLPTETPIAKTVLTHY